MSGATAAEGAAREVETVAVAVSEAEAEAEAVAEAQTWCCAMDLKEAGVA